MMTDTPTRCPSTATVEPGGALVRCTLDAGHDVDQPLVTLSYALLNGSNVIGTAPATLHEYVLTWANPEGVDIDADIYDPDETFDLEVDIEPIIELMHKATGRRYGKPTGHALDEPDVAMHPAMPPIPDNLCGIGGCVYLEGHALRDYSRGRHSWEF